jgi:nitronate monooxygenase
MAFAPELTKCLGLAVPILSAPMAGVAGGALAAAVSRAGGLGLIGGGYGDREWLTRELDIAADAQVGVGFITWALARNPDLLTIAHERQPRAIFLSFGDIGPYASRIAGAGLPLIAQVQTVEGARAAVGGGAGIIVAQGTEAGGHGGERATMALVPAVVDAVGDIPVVAAGGIADGRGLAAALMLGAAGVLCGTAFYACRESLAHPKAKDAAVGASGDRTVRGKVFDIVRGYDWPEPWKIRTLENRSYHRWASDPEALERDLPRQRQAYLTAQARGDIDTAAVIVGEGIDLVHEVERAAAVVSRIANEAEDRLRGSQRGAVRLQRAVE